jgi:hypothetical protein
VPCVIVSLCALRTSTILHIANQYHNITFLHLLIDMPWHSGRRPRSGSTAARHHCMFMFFVSFPSANLCECVTCERVSVIGDNDER